MSSRALGKSRIVLAPEPELMAGALAPNRVFSVNLKPGEEVQWLWTSTPDGRYVSGYQIVRAHHPRGSLARMAPRRRSIPNSV